jgi:hypothetical protein
MVWRPDMSARWGAVTERPAHTATPSASVLDEDWDILGAIIETQGLRAPRWLPPSIERLIAGGMVEVVTVSARSVLQATPAGDLAYLDHAQAPALAAAHAA